MARIVIDARIIYTSTGRYVERLLHYLQALDHQNEYIVLLNQEDSRRWEPTASNFTKQLANYPPYTFREQLGLWRQLRSLQPDLVHFTMPQQPLAYRGRRVTTIHDLTLINYVNRRRSNPFKDFYKYALKPLIFRLALRSVVKRSAELITPTQYVAHQLIDQLHSDPNHTTFTHEAAERLADRPKAIPSLVDTDFILYVGNAFPYKNLSRLLEAAATLKDHKLVLAGKPDYFYEQLRQQSKDSSYSNIIFAEFVSDGELAWLYHHAKLYVFPSLSEGFGLPGLEAMSYGLPVASSNATCLPEVYGEAAAYFDPLDVRGMASTLSDLLAHPKKLAALKQAGLEQVKLYSWKRMAEQTLEVYQRALKPADRE